MKQFNNRVMKQVNIKIIKNNKAFSLLEVTLAMGVLVIGILGVFSLVIQNAQVQNYNKHYLIASMLVQEGIEIVRNKRDNNWIDDTIPAWYEGIANGNGEFIVDYSDPSSFDFSIDNIANARLYLDSDNFYTHTAVGNTASPFYRLIEIHDFTDHGGSDTEEDAFRVLSKVQWDEHGQTHKYIAETLLYNWRGL